MATLKDWNDASEKYCILLEEMVKELRSNANGVPNDHAVLLALDAKNEEVLRAGHSLQENIKRLRPLTPLSDA